LWENGKLSASEKRGLVTKFVGSAWDKIFFEWKVQVHMLFPENRLHADFGWF
jgi:hypothetical protein